MKPESPWTTTALELFDELIAAGKSYQEIAVELSAAIGYTFTKSACIGRAHRDGVPPRNPGRRRARPRTRSAKQIARRRKTSPQAPTPIVCEPHSGPVDLFALRDGDCHWPFGVAPPFRYCAQPKTKGCSYCEEHARVVFTHWPPRNA